MNEEKKRNEMIVAERDIRVYLGECDILFQSFDAIVLKCLDSYVNTVRSIALIKGAVGIEIDPHFLNSLGKIEYKTEEVQVTNPKTGRMETRRVHRLGLIKNPKLFMFTNPKKAIEIPPLE